MLSAEQQVALARAQKVLVERKHEFDRANGGSEPTGPVAAEEANGTA